MKVFLSLAKYNVNDHESAMKLLLETVVKVEEVKEFERAISFYKDHLNEVLNKGVNVWRLHYHEGEKVFDWTRLFNYATKLFIVCPSNCTSCAERSCAWVIIRLHVCHSNHHVFLHYSKKILVNVYSSCCNSWLYFCEIYYSK